MTASDKDIIKLVVEKMSKMKHRISKGYGSSQPYRVKASRPSLGQPGIKTGSKEKNKEDPSPVKISRAFSKK